MIARTSNANLRLMHEIQFLDSDGTIGGLGLEQRIDEGCDGGSFGEDDEASEQTQCDENGKQPEFFSGPHIQPKLR